ncbi:MAG: hypothetical protein NTU98_11050 [Bacteroidetes bacterium]|nr:hypothetical protein [Bacteroidota bacterium]
MRSIVLSLIAVLLLASCKRPPVLENTGFNKDPGNKTKVFYTIESAYYVTSYSKGVGITTSQGFTRRYINAVNPVNGEKIKSVRVKGKTEYIGSAGGKAWFFSIDPKLKFHARDPLSLDIVVSSGDILKKNQDLKSGLSDQAGNYSMDTTGKYIFFTANDGYYYLLDPVSLNVKKTGQEAGRSYYELSNKELINTTLRISDSMEVYFRGNTRASLVLEKQKTIYTGRVYNVKRPGSDKRVEIREKDIKPVTEELKDISLIDPAILADITKPISVKPQTSIFHSNPYLCDSGTIFILSQSTIDFHTFNWIVTALDLDFYKAGILWQTEIGQTEKVNSFDKQFLGSAISDDNLVMVFKNMLLGMNKKTGNIVWRKDYITKSR